jgi:hypothetical protein
VHEDGELYEKAKAIPTPRIDRDGVDANDFDFKARPLAQNPIELEIEGEVDPQSQTDILSRSNKPIYFYFVPFDDDKDEITKLFIYTGDSTNP